MTEKTLVSVRPRRSLITTGFISVVLGMIPLFGVLYWFSIEHDSWLIVFVVHLVVTAMCLLAIVRQLTVYSAVTETELVGRGIFSPLIRVPLDKIASVHLVETYVGQAPESVTQLLVNRCEGKRLFRMRGNFYRDGDLKAIAAALPVHGAGRQRADRHHRVLPHLPGQRVLVRAPADPVDRRVRGLTRGGARRRRVGDDDPRDAGGLRG